MNALYPEVRLTLEDDSGICHVRCVGEFAIRARRLFPGQKVLLTDLIDSKESSQHHEGLLFEMTNTSMLYACKHDYSFSRKNGIYSAGSTFSELFSRIADLTFLISIVTSTPSWKTEMVSCTWNHYLLVSCHWS